MASCVRNIHAKNYQNLVIGFKVTVKNVGDVIFRDTVYCLQTDEPSKHTTTTKANTAWPPLQGRLIMYLSASWN